MTLLYPIENSLYVNITNLCCCKCVFCVRDITDSVGGSDSLWLDHEPTIDELKAELEKFNLDEYEEVVFCGYGEPLMRINEVVEFANYIKTKKNIKIRVNTNGLADLIHKKKTAVLLKDAIDAVSISLNAPNEEVYLEVAKPAFGIKSFDAMLSFAKDCKTCIKEVCFSVVDEITDEEIRQSQELADSLDIPLRVRVKNG
ncbi:MAG: TIGR04100 family radical SAM protein [Clostridiales bacterium]|jgi:radical SAM enzyme (TIGR04100 family)|uniref:TIGR04100 family radical SAM protein n=1 Tax=Clostridium sp. 2218st1_F5_2218SCRN_220325 TaxID=3143056 RepID=UPI0026014F90|nr:TIGR04100 family radical SAM protein [uncultured Intestinibacter sp.]MDU1201801.1 TIGR04100 family radical SAM protein [Clostridiales bacterium]